MAVFNGSSLLGLFAGAVGQRLDPYQSCNFIVEIDQLLAGAFSSCSGLQVETEVHDYREGGQNEYLHRFVGPTKHPPLVLKQGLSPIDGMWQWHQNVVAGNTLRRNGTIYLLNARGVPVMWWNFKKALPVKWTGPELDAQKGVVAFESMEIVHHGLSRPQLETKVAAVAGEVATRVTGEVVRKVTGVDGFF